MPALHRRRIAAAGASLGAAVLLGLGSPAVASAAQPSSAAPSSHVPSSRLATVSAAPRLPAGSRVLHAVASTAPVTATVALRLPDQPAVTDFIDATSDPRSPDYHHYLARGQFTRQFGPSPATVGAVERQLKADGLDVTSVSANHLLITFKGRASQVEAAFHTGLERVALAGGAVGQATTSSLRLPASIAPDVQAIIGLDQLVHESDGLKRPTGQHHGITPAAAVPKAPNGGPIACSAATAQQANGALTDQQVADSYGVEPLYAAGDLASDQTVDIYELEPFATSDIATFDKCYFGSSHTGQITRTIVDGGSGTGPGSGEAELDVEDVSALAPGAKIDVFSGPNMEDPFGPLDTWNAIATADNARQVSSSWGACETLEQQGAPGEQQVENEIFEQTAAQGQTVFSSAGDDGSDDCAGHGSTPVATDLSLDDPASQPYVTSVGGTTILDASEPPKETVWNNGNAGGAGGGGISETWAMPSWQTSMAVPQTAGTEACSNDPSGTADNFHLQGIATTLPPGTMCRETPDVSALADPQGGITVYLAGQWTQIGGTSSSTPLWAAMLAEVNHSSGCSALPNGVGFADPSLYQIAATSATDYADAFNDVTVGNNDDLGVGGAVDWRARTGYDLATGLGTPRITDANGSPGLASQLCAVAAGSGGTAPPQVTSLTQLTGNTGLAGGGTLRVAGTGFGATKGSVFFGNVGAAVVSWTATAITIDIPAYHAPPGTVAGAAGSADVTVVTAGSAPRSSSPTASSVYHYTANSSGGPAVDYVSSSTGPTDGGNTVKIVGAGLTGATSVHFGDQVATSITPINDNELRATVPASDAHCAVSAAQGMCAVAVTVTTPAGTSSGPTIQPAYQGPLVFSPNGAFVPPAGCGCEVVPAPEEYDYAPAPTITSVGPAFASEDGTTTEIITGTGFNLLDFEWVNIGQAGQQFSEDFGLDSVAPDQLAVTAFPAEPSTQPVASPISVQTSGGLSNVSSFDYAGIPTLTKLSKHLAAQADPGNLTITGTGLSDVSSVVFQAQGDLDFLSSTSTTISKQTGTSLTVAVPQFFTIPTDVLVCSVTGCSGPDPKVDAFQEAYAGRPVVNSSSPSSGPAHGGTKVTINGALDTDVTAVDFGSKPATIVSQTIAAPSGPVIVMAPPGSAGTKVSITITTLGGLLTSPPQPRSALNAAATFTYKKSTPTAARDVAAKAGVGQVTVTWKAPTNDGGDPLTGYVVTGTAKGQKSLSVNEPAKVTKATFTKLKAHVAWTFTVRAKSKLGAGLPATAKPVTPT